MSEVDAHRNPITLTRFILAEQARVANATGDFTILLQSVQLAVKAISNAMSRAGIAKLYGIADNQGPNPTGDTQKKLDVFSDECFINSMRFSQKIAALVSEEQERIIEMEDCKDGKYVICFDPLDGSSNIDANVSVGTIFGIFKVTGDKPVAEQVLRPGTELAAAGYALYGAATMLVLSTGNGVNGFTLDRTLGEFILTHKKIRVPDKGKVYSINEGNSHKFDKATHYYVNEICKNQEKKSLRYIGSMVSDVHRTLLYGGVFAYPGTKGSESGKLRLLYEAAPMAFLVEQAGGRAIDGRARVLDIVPEDIHQKCPIFLGSAQDVARVEEAYAKFPEGWAE